jgi:oligopeptide transport system substrate-binding protein
MKTFSKPLFLLLALCFAFASCSSNPKKVNTSALRINIGSEPQTLDPRKARGTSSLTVVRMLFEGLTRIDPSDQPVLSAADNVQISDDLKTYTFHLRKSYWSNKQQVTAGDFSYAWKKILDPQFPSDYASQLYVIKNAKAAKEGKVSLDAVGIKVLDPLTIQVELEAPTPYFLELLAFPIFFPVNQRVDQADPKWADNCSTYVGNGPFTLVEWKHQDHLLVEKNEHYWDKEAVKLSQIQLVMVTEDTELKMYEKNELDWAGSPLSTLPLDALKSLKQNKSLIAKPLLGTYFIRTNTEKPPFTNKNIRKAFALAVNRQAIVDHVTQGNQIPATGLVPSSMQLQKEVCFEDANQIMAKDLFAQGLEELKMTKDALPEVTLTYGSNERNHLIAQTVQQQWMEAFGIKVKLEALEPKVYFDRVSKQNFQLASGNWIADFNDPVNFLEVFKYKKASTNNTSWENTEYQSLLDQSSLIADAGKRKEVLKKSEQLLLQEMPIIPIFYFTMLYVKKDQVKNVIVSSLGNMDFKWASLEAGQESKQ